MVCTYNGLRLSIKKEGKSFKALMKESKDDTNSPPRGVGWGAGREMQEGGEMGIYVYL